MSNDNDDKFTLDESMFKDNEKSDVKVDPEAQAVLDAQKAMTVKLSDDEKEKIKAKKQTKEAKSEPKVEIVKENWKEESLTDDEKAKSIELQNAFVEFLNDKTDLAESAQDIETFPTGIDLLDAILGGGFGCGTLSLIVGNPGTFKSALVAQIIGASQKKFAGKLLASYADSENAMSLARLWQMGVQNPPIKPYTDITVEDIFKIIEGYTAFKELRDVVHIPSIVAWDSIANTITNKEKNSDGETDPNKFIGLKPRILSTVLPKYIAKMREYNISLIAVNQLREKLDMGQYASQNDIKYLGMDKTMPGGQSIKYNAFHLLFLKQGPDLKIEQWGFDGILLKAKCAKNKLFTPNVEIEMIVDFTKGISNFWTNYHFLSKHKRIQAGAWGYLKSLPTVKWQGTKKCLEMYESNKDGFKEAFDEAVKECIQTEIVERYSDIAELERLQEALNNG